MTKSFTDRTAEFVDIPYKLGAGGYNYEMRGMMNVARTDWIMSASGDTLGAYLWCMGDAEWRNPFTYSRLITKGLYDSFIASYGGYAGSFGLCVANDLQTIYFGGGSYLFRSDDRFATFDFVSGFGRLERGGGGTEADGNNREWKHQRSSRMAVDPVNPSILYVGTPKGYTQPVFANGCLIRTLNKGVAFQEVTAIPIPNRTFNHTDGSPPSTNYECPRILFDKSQGTVTGDQTSGSDPQAAQWAGVTRTKRIWISSWGNGVYISDNGGQTWTLNAGSGTKPTTVNHWTVGPTGILDCLLRGSGPFDDAYGASDSVWRLATPLGTWTNITPAGMGGGVYAISADPNPARAGRIIVINGNSTLQQRNAAGAWNTSGTWIFHDCDYTDPAAVKYMAEVNLGHNHLNAGQVVFHPWYETYDSELWCSEGFGRWRSTNFIPTRGFGGDTTKHVYINISAGEAEQLVAGPGIHPGPGLSQLSGGHDLCVQTKQPGMWNQSLEKLALGRYIGQPHPEFGPGNNIPALLGDVSDFAYSEHSPNFVVATMGDAYAVNAYSWDGGRYWRLFDAQPYSAFGVKQGTGGLIAVNHHDPRNIVCTGNLGVIGPASANPTGAPLRYTTNLGKTWKTAIPPAPFDVTKHKHFAAIWDYNAATCKRLVADPNNAGHFYLWIAEVPDDTPVGQGLGFYKSVNGGATWTLQTCNYPAVGYSTGGITATTTNAYFLPGGVVIRGGILKMFKSKPGVIIASAYGTGFSPIITYDYGANWVNLYGGTDIFTVDIRQVFGFTVGKKVAGDTDLTLYFNGEVNGPSGWQWGFYRSRNFLAGPLERLRDLPSWGMAGQGMLWADQDVEGLFSYPIGSAGGFRSVKPAATTLPAPRSVITAA